MEPQQLEQLAATASERYFAPDTLVLGPAAQPPEHLIFLRQGRLLGRRQGSREPEDAFELEAGSLLPVAALLAQRPVTSTYTALEDCFCLFIPRAQVLQLMVASPVWADFLHGRMQAMMAVIQQRWQLMQHAQLQQQYKLERPLADMPVRQPVMRPSSQSLREVLELMRSLRIGSVLLTDDAVTVSGILTRGDVLERVTLAGVCLQTPASAVMSRPVITIDAEQSAFEAAMLMTRHRLRHLPVMVKGRLWNIVSERDLFALQNQSTRHVGGLIARAASTEQLQQAAAQIRSLTVHLMALGLLPAQLTRLISQLNDSLTRRIIELALPRHGLNQNHMCWLALGSEGRCEQTIATDQDNALIYAVDQDQARWLAFAQEVNQTLDACGFPLCTGGVMASNPQCCLTLAQWRQRFAQWIEQGSPQELLKASVFFDLRPLAGRADWTESLSAAVRHQAMQTPRFIAQWVKNHLQTEVPLSWYGALQTRREGVHEWIDLKLKGTAIVVDAARILALSQGISAYSTADRLERAGERLGIPVSEYRGWLRAFDHLQTLRLRQQTKPDRDPGRANCLDVDDLDQVDRQVLKVSFSVIRDLQQRLRLDYVR